MTSKGAIPTPVSAVDAVEKARVAVLGGSFDPVHQGHLEMAGAVQKASGIRRIVFMPCYVSPFKEGTVATVGQRLDMLRLALEDSDLTGLEISTFELERPGPSYTHETAAALADKEPDSDWHWIVGADQWEVIEEWSGIAVLRSLLHFLVLAREGHSVRSRAGWRFTPVPFSHPASSTAIRESFDAHRDWLAPGVVRYCERAGLYRSSG